jgi:hypothetical protein|tara:strand:+ start:791 stop:1531 length:741 start_codon:yes stop_codon:yes gene_type:complete
MARFARGKHAYGISDRSGFRYRLRDMRLEWNGSLVGKDEFEAKHPQLEPKRVFADAQALRNARPDSNNIFNIDVTFPVFNLNTLVFESNIPQMTGSIGTVTFGGAVTTGTSISVTASGVEGTTAVGDETASGTTGLAATYTVTVASYYGSNKYYIDSSRQATVNLSEGSTYRFDQSDSSNSGHPLRFSTTSDGTHASGSEYTTGVTTNGTPGSSGAYTQITVASGAPTLYYYCTNHSGMGGTANTP